MPMGPRISAYRIFFDVRADGVRRKMQQDAARPLATCTVIDQLKNPGTSAMKFASHVRWPSTTLPLPLKYPSSPLNRSENAKELLKMKSTLRKRLIITGASVSATNLAGSSRL